MLEITSAAGVLSLLDEPDPQLQVQALEILDTIVDDFWAEISDYIVKIETLFEDKSFSHRELAALIASKVYYNLGEFEDALTYALGAGPRFNPNEKSQFVQTLISKCIDKYIELRSKRSGEAIDQRLEQVVNGMFQACLDRGEIKQAIGIALEAARVDVLQEAVRRSDDKKQILGYCLEVCMTVIQSREFRNTFLRVLVDLYTELDTQEYNSVCQCLMFLDDFMRVADILSRLIGCGEDEMLVAYQVAADVEENATQHFIANLRRALPKPDALEGEDTGAVDKETYADRLRKLDTLLSGAVEIDLRMEYLYRNKNVDYLILKNTKNAVLRNSACHTATVIANAYMHAGTTVHQFLHDNLEWLGRATNWAKFTATASLGVIHKGHFKESRNVLSRYLPKDIPSSPYSEGGSLFALGLIHANHGDDVLDYLLTQLHQEQTSDFSHREILQSGAAMGIACAAMATDNQDVYDQLKEVLDTDSAVAGEGAGLAMGLVMLGSANEQAIQDMVNYAHETQHEKIIRGLALGIAFTMYCREEEADALIESLCADKDPLLRFSGMYTIAMAYIGTGNNRAILKLLHFAVSDVNDDVRRAAVTSLGFLLCRSPQQVPAVVSLLSESYNPHVRYGAALAVGIACAGTGMQEALDLLEPMTRDAKNFVRQGALLAMGMICIQQSEAKNPKVATVRKLLETIINDKNEDGKTGDVSAKFGAILAQGIIDAGGRNVTISLASRTGVTSMTTAVGLLCFTQFWFWYPMANFLGLAFTPTTLIALNKDLKMPKLQFKSNCKPSMFAYPPETKPPQTQSKEKVSTAVLSITQKQKHKQKAKSDAADEKKADQGTNADKDKAKETDKPADAEPMSVDGAKEDGAEGDAMQTDAPASEEPKEEEKKKKEPEPLFSMLENPARVTVQQRAYVTLEDPRWTPMRDLAGIVFVKDNTPDQPVEMVELLAPKPETSAEKEEEEPAPPEPFEFDSDRE